MSSDVDRAFAADVQQRSPAALRMGALVTVLGYIGFAIVDFFVVGASVRDLLAVRAAAIVGILAVYAASWPRWRRLPAEAYGVAMLLVVGLGVVVLAVLAGGAQNRYHDPLALTIVGYSVLLPTSVVYALPAFLILTSAYAGALAYTGLTASTAIYLTNTATLLLASLLGIALVIMTGRSKRREFTLTYALAQANVGLKALDGAKSEFFANISHELRTPLTLIIASVESLRESLESAGGSAPQQVDTCRRNGLRLLRLVDDMLQLSRLEAAQQPLRARAVNLRDMVVMLVDQLRPLAGRRGVEVVADVDGAAEAVVEGDESMIERVWLNLAANAIKFTGEGGRVTLGLRRRDDRIEGWVTDTGEGMPAAALERIFERFYQVQASRSSNRGGVGIGLSLVKHIVERHGGQVTATSAVGHGTTMSFWLPIGPPSFGTLVTEEAAASAAPTAALETRPPRQGLAEWDSMLRSESDYRLYNVTEVTERRAVDRGSPGKSSRGPLVLLVDDNADILELLAGVLGGDYQIQTATDGREGLRQAQKLRPDVIISDVSMPNMSGFELLAALRQSPETADTPVILLTARGQPSDRLSATEGGADAYLPKPFHPQELRSTLRNLVRKQVAQAAAAIDERSLALRVMAEGVAHDTLNPLGFVRGALLILARIMEETIGLLGPAHPRATELAEDADQFLRSAREGLERAVAAIGELRRFSRGDTSTAVARIDVNDAARRVATVAGTQGKVITKLLAKRAVALRPGQLEQVLLNLVLNAQQAAGVESEVELRTSDDPASAGVLLCVQDSGPGMDRKTVQKIFDPYFTTKQMGTGLGLTVSRQIIRDGGGSLGVESEPGIGTTFTIRLPCGEPPL